MKPVAQQLRRKLPTLIILGAISVWLSLLTSYIYAAKVHIYEVIEMTGKVWIRGANQPRWQSAREGLRLAEGQLIQVTTGASVTLREVLSKTRDGDDTGQRFQLRITQPITARVTHDMLRRVNVRTHFVEDKGALLAGEVTFRDFKLSLADAWQRLTSVVTGRVPRVSQATLAELAKEGMALGTSSRKLSILAPVSNAVVESSDWPIDLKVVWRHPEAQHLKYLVYLWPAGSARGSPTGMTENDFFTVQIREAGTYIVQVTSRGGAWQSYGHVIHAIIPENRSMAKKGEILQKTAREILRPNYPPDHTTLLIANPEEGAVDFAWESDLLQTADMVVMTVLRTDGRVVHQERTRETQLRVPLPPGRYEWYLSSEPSGSSSARRSLAILGQDAIGGQIGKSELIRKTLLQQGSASLFLDSGL